MSDQVTWCGGCRQPFAGECATCKLRRGVGAIVEAVFYPLGPVREPRPMELDALEALAELLIRHGLTVRHYRRELNEQAREASRDARDAHAEGYSEALRMGEF